MPFLSAPALVEGKIAALVPLIAATLLEVVSFRTKNPIGPLATPNLAAVLPLLCKVIAVPSLTLEVIAPLLIVPMFVRFLDESMTVVPDILYAVVLIKLLTVIELSPACKCITSVNPP